MSEAIIEAGAWIYKMLITLIVAVVAIAIVATSIVNNVNTRDLQAQLVLNRILYSPDGFWYKQNGQTYPGILDGALLSDHDAAQLQLNNAFNYKEGYVGVQITIIPQDPRVTRLPYSPLYISKNTWDALNAPIRSNQKRSGIYEQHNYPVIIRGQGDDIPAIMQVELVLREEA